MEVSEESHVVHTTSTRQNQGVDHSQPDNYQAYQQTLDRDMQVQPDKKTRKLSDTGKEDYKRMRELGACDTCRKQHKKGGLPLAP